MERQTSKVLLVLACLAGCGGGVMASDLEAQQGEDKAAYRDVDTNLYDPYYNESSRSDFIAVDAGNAPQANIAIQNPTPWPAYVNNTHFHTDGRVGELVIKKFLGRSAKPVAAAPTINFNISQPAAGQ